jgi:hypothetical protein
MVMNRSAVCLGKKEKRRRENSIKREKTGYLYIRLIGCLEVKRSLD